MPSRQVLDVEGLGHKHPIPLGVRMGPLLVTGSISGIDRADGTYPEDVEAEIRNAFDNVRAVLAAGGAGMPDVAKVDVLLSDKKHREQLNLVWVELFPSPTDRPARHTTEQPLPPGMRVQLSVTAVLD